MEWTKSDTLKFIELWQECPCLWNNKINEFKDRQKRHDALEYIAEQTNTNVGAVEKKILSLKTQYNRELKKLKTAGKTGIDDVPSSSWYAFQHLHFLKNTNVLCPDSLVITLTQDREEEDEEDTTTENISQESNLSITSIQQQNIPQQPRFIKRKRHNQFGTFNLLRDASNALIHKQKRDEFSIFGETIANELREMKSKRHILVLKKKIMDLVYETKLEIFDNDNANL